MTIIEAFACGVPVVSFDCPRGPREIITSGYDGLLVPADDVDALAGGLLQMIEDEEGRRLMAANALQTARGYDISMIVNAGRSPSPNSDADAWDAWAASRVGTVRVTGGAVCAGSRDRLVAGAVPGWNSRVE